MALQDRTTNRGFVPGARIIILTREPYVKAGGSLIGAEFLEIKEFLDVTVSSGIGRINTCNITLSNLGDRWFNKARAVPNSTVRQREIVEYLKKVISISEMTERNFERRREFFDLLERKKIRKEDRDISKYYKLDDNGKASPSGFIPGTRVEEYSNFEYIPLDFDLMRRVWVDFKDRDGNWAPGFTGYISSVAPVYNPGQVSTLTLGCKGTLGLFQRSEIIVQESIDPRYEPFRKDQLVSRGQSMLTTNLAGLSGEQIIQQVMGLVQNSYCYNTGDTAKKRSEEYFFQEKLWKLKGDTYRGETLKSSVGYGRDELAYQPIRDWDERTLLEDMIGKLIIDPEIVDPARKRYEVFQQAIRTGLKLYENRAEYAYNICKRAADLVGYDFFEDPKGNIVFQSPKYDKLPRFSGEQKISNEDLSMTMAEPIVGVPDGFEPSYTNDYSNIPYHARDYILDHIGLKSRRYSESEDGIVTFVTTHAMPNIITGFSGEVLKAEQQTGYTAYSRMKELNIEIADRLIALNRRFGIRRHDMQPMIAGGIGNPRLLDRWALQTLNTINSNIKAGTVSLHHRPDIWIGKTVFLVEEQKLAYVIGTTNTFNMSAKGAHDTQLSLAYIHHPSEAIGIPWQLATEKETDFAVTGSELFEEIQKEIDQEWRETYPVQETTTGPVGFFPDDEPTPLPDG